MNYFVTFLNHLTYNIYKLIIMKKYKHKTTGVVVTQHFYKETKVYPEHYDYEYKRSETAAIHSSIDAMFVENSNDWEEVITSTNLNMQFIDTMVKEESNYLITAFGNVVAGTWYLQNDGKYKYSETCIKTLDEMFKSMHHFKNEFIKSVKNSKGEEFTIGDAVMCEKEKFTISHFHTTHIELNIIMAVFNETNAKLNNLNGSNIELISKVMSPIYTTTDSVDIYEGYNVTLHLLNKDLAKCIRNKVNIFKFNEQDKEVADRYLTFTSEENRDKYIKENTKKPIFISADGKEMYEGDAYYVPQINNENELIGIYLKLKVLTHCKANKTSFSSAELAQEYIDNNKPKYSIFDIKSVLSEISFDNTRISEVIIEDLYKLKK